MLRRLILSFVLAFQNIRSNFFHTILSILGIIIGVAALVGILSLIDGAEQFARRQISQTTSLNAIIVQSEAFKRVNGVRVRKDSLNIIDYREYLSFKEKFQNNNNIYLRTTASDEIFINETSQSFGSITYGSVQLLKPNAELHAGRSFNETDITDNAFNAIVNYKASSLISQSDSVHLALGKELSYQGKNYTVVGILNDKTVATPEVYIPITTLSHDELRNHLPVLAIEANSVEEVPSIRKELELFMETRFGSYKDDFTIVTNEFRVQQAQQAFLLFRVIMGIIVGISVLVGGIGVMNVLLISVTERTSEIGIRKAVGASRRDILMQFMCEAITVSTFGSIAGLAIGVLATMGAVPIIRAITEAPFQAAFTANTLIVVSLVALAVGLIFGTYPAFRASKLDPVEAIRRE